MIIGLPVNSGLLWSSVLPDGIDAAESERSADLFTL